VLTADRYPGEMQGLQDRLLSRFQSGLSVDIQPPDFEVRVAILMDKAERNGVDLPYDIIEFIATHMRSNIRDLEGTIIRLLARSSLMNQDIDRELVQEVVKERIGSKPTRDLSMEDIVRKVSELSGIPEESIVGKSRRKEIVEARQTAMFLCRNILDSSLSSVGMYFGGRDHTTVIHAIKTIEEKKTKKKNIGEHISQITQELSFF
jgi:chromosomal replication initiator protein